MNSVAIKVVRRSGQAHKQTRILKKNKNKKQNVQARKAFGAPVLALSPRKLSIICEKMQL